MIIGMEVTKVVTAVIFMRAVRFDSGREGADCSPRYKRQLKTVAALRDCVRCVNSPLSMVLLAALTGKPWFQLRFYG
jgi:hypothetical protein